jgi:hypothetical protein
VQLKTRGLWVGGVAEVVECLPSKCEALNSNPTKKEEEVYIINWYAKF